MNVSNEAYDDALDQLWKLCGGNDHPVYKLFLSFRIEFSGSNGGMMFDPKVLFDPNAKTIEEFNSSLLVPVTTVTKEWVSSGDK